MCGRRRTALFNYFKEYFKLTYGSVSKIGDREARRGRDDKAVKRFEKSRGPIGHPQLAVSQGSQSTSDMQWRWKRQLHKLGTTWCEGIRMQKSSKRTLSNSSGDTEPIARKSRTWPASSTRHSINMLSTQVDPFPIVLAQSKEPVKKGAKDSSDVPATTLADIERKMNFPSGLLTLLSRDRPSFIWSTKSSTNSRHRSDSASDTTKFFTDLENIEALPQRPGHFPEPSEIITKLGPPGLPKRMVSMKQRLLHIFASDGITGPEEAKAFVNTRDTKQRLPLECAITSGNYTACAVFIELGASREAKTSTGITLTKYARTIAKMSTEERQYDIEICGAVVLPHRRSPALPHLVKRRSEGNKAESARHHHSTNHPVWTNS